MSTTPRSIAQAIEEIKVYAVTYGLDFFKTIFEVVDYGQVNAFASYGGFPTRYPHWRFGMEYEELSKSYSYGLSKIYEMVINNDPCYAYLMRSNMLVDQKLVIAHVYGHGDFFKNNLWFSKTNRKMMDDMANHSVRVQRHIDKHGEEQVEDFIDTCLSIENLIDPHSVFFKKTEPPENGKADGKDDKDSEAGRFKFKTEKEYMEAFINPPEVVEKEKEKWLKDQEDTRKKYPTSPQRDVLLFLMQHAPIEEWQRDILSIIREEAYYFAPQGQTKIMNEGWATYWHSKIMTTKVLSDSEVIDYADHHSGTVAMQPGRLNPYKLGLELLRDIEDRWNKGKFGKEYDECDDYRIRKDWDKDLGLGMEKLFEVRKMYNDVMFIDAFLTADFAREHQLFTYDYNQRSGYYEISDRDFEIVKQRLLYSLTNWGQPFIFVEEANYKNRGELYLSHRHEGIDLKIDEAQDTLMNIQKIWNRPVNLETRLSDKKVLFCFDGEEHKTKDLE
ncbi:MAG: SpoVR family protein [bacterium]